MIVKMMIMMMMMMMTLFNMTMMMTVRMVTMRMVTMMTITMMMMMMITPFAWNLARYREADYKYIPQLTPTLYNKPRFSPSHLH